MWIRLISKDTDSSVQLHDPRGPHAIPHEIPWDSRSPSVALQPQWLRDPWDPENPKTLSSRRAILSYLILPHHLLLLILLLLTLLLLLLLLLLPLLLLLLLSNNNNIDKV